MFTLNGNEYKTKEGTKMEDMKSWEKSFDAEAEVAIDRKNERLANTRTRAK